MTKYQIVRAAIDKLIKKNAFGHTFCKEDYEELEKLYDDNSFRRISVNELVDIYTSLHPTETPKSSMEVITKPIKSSKNNKKNKRKDPLDVVEPETTPSE